MAFGLALGYDTLNTCTEKEIEVSVMVLELACGKDLLLGFGSDFSPLAPTPNERARETKGTNRLIFNFLRTKTMRRFSALALNKKINLAFS